MYWWNKAQQGIMFLEDMLHNSSSNDEEKEEEDPPPPPPPPPKNRIRLSGPAILAVLTVETTNSNEFKSGRLGTFLVTPQNVTTAAASAEEDHRDANDFRVCLLSKFETAPESIENGATTPSERLLEMSRALGRVIEAAGALPALDVAAAATTTKATMDLNRWDPTAVESETRSVVASVLACA